MRTWNKLLKFAGAMKCYTQVYVINSMEAAETYCRAFGAKVTYGIKNDAQTEALLLKQSMSCHGANAVLPSLTGMEQMLRCLH